MDPRDVAALTALEESLWRAATRFDRDHLGRVLAADFDEFGASGRHWTRSGSIDSPAEDFEAVLPLPDLRMRALGPDAALVTCTSTTTWPADGVARSAHRSSVWQRQEGAWRLRFHQGTPTAPQAADSVAAIG